MNKVYTDYEPKTATIAEFEKIRLEDYNNKAIFHSLLYSDRPEDCKWKISNCRIQSVGHLFLCNAYNYTLKQAIELAKKEFYE